MSDIFLKLLMGTLVLFVCAAIIIWTYCAVAAVAECIRNRHWVAAIFAMMTLWTVALVSALIVSGLLEEIGVIGGAP